MKHLYGIQICNHKEGRKEGKTDKRRECLGLYRYVTMLYKVPEHLTCLLSMGILDPVPQDHHADLCLNADFSQCLFGLGQSHAKKMTLTNLGDSPC